MPSKRIVLLLHKDDRLFFSMKYLIQLLMEEWKGMGFAVEMIQGTKHVVPADVIIPHVDLTITPKQYCNFWEQYSMVINRHVVDISKSKISHHLLREKDTYDGPVIVKTDCNSGGMPEEHLKSYSIPARLRRRIVSKIGLKRLVSLSWRNIQSIKPHNYPVFPSLREVPKEIFKNRCLIVEKFLPETDGDNYCLRFYYFFGKNGFNILAKSKDKVIRGRNIFRVEEAPIPNEIDSIRQQLGFDYGKFDYVLRNGRVVLFDTNRTPIYGLLERNRLARKAAHHLADGIWSMI